MLSVAETPMELPETPRTSWAKAHVDNLVKHLHEEGFENYVTTMTLVIALPIKCLADTFWDLGVAVLMLPVVLLKAGAGLVGMADSFPQNYDLQALASQVSKVVAHLSEAVAVTVTIPFALVAPRYVVPWTLQVMGLSSGQIEAKETDSEVSQVPSESEEVLKADPGIHSLRTGWRRWLEVARKVVSKAVGFGITLEAKLSGRFPRTSRVLKVGSVASLGLGLAAWGFIYLHDVKRQYEDELTRLTQDVLILQRSTHAQSNTLFSERQGNAEAQAALTEALNKTKIELHKQIHELSAENLYLNQTLQNITLERGDLNLTFQQLSEEYQDLWSSSWRWTVSLLGILAAGAAGVVFVAKQAWTFHRSTVDALDTRLKTTEQERNQLDGENRIKDQEIQKLGIEKITEVDGAKRVLNEEIERLKKEHLTKETETDNTIQQLRGQLKERENEVKEAGEWRLRLENLRKPITTGVQEQDYQFALNVNSEGNTGDRWANPEGRKLFSREFIDKYRDTVLHELKECVRTSVYALSLLDLQNRAYGELCRYRDRELAQQQPQIEPLPQQPPNLPQNNRQHLNADDIFN